MCERESILRTSSKYCLRRPVTSNVMSLNCYRENEENLTIIRKNRKSKHFYCKLILLLVVIQPRTIATFRLQYEDGYEYELSVLSTHFRLAGENFRSARAQNLKFVLVVVLVFQSEGR